MRLPEAAAAEPAEALPAIEVGNIPGAAVPVRAGFHSDHVTLRVVCATAPSRGWAPGIEDIVMGRASQIARSALGGEVTRFEGRAIVAAGGRFEERFAARVTRGPDVLAVEGRHVLGFAGEAKAAVVCSVVCAEPAPRACAALVEAAAPVGAWTAPPDPSLVVRGILLAADHPAAAAAGMGAAVIAILALVIARRPRPRAR